jgi:hypothetical protein
MHSGVKRRSPNVDDAERNHLLARNEELDRARRRWKLVALAGITAFVLLALALTVTTSLALQEALERERQAEWDLQAVQEGQRQALAEARLAMANDAPQGRPLALTLEAVEREVTAGTTPRFRLTVTNASNVAQKVLDIREREDLQHTYYDLEVTRDGKPVRLPRAISDPGPVTDKDFLSLAPGGSVTFALERFPVALKDLPPGTYQASVGFWQDPYQSHKTSYRSPEVTFVVRE